VRSKAKLRNDRAYELAESVIDADSLRRTDKPIPHILVEVVSARIGLLVTIADCGMLFR
jgi:hypothetical protein